VLAILLALQVDVTIQRTDPAKADYLAAGRKCKEAQALMESDAARAVELLDAILANEKIVKRDCRLKVEERPGDASDFPEFFPHQFRGRLRLKRGNEKALRDALADFEASVKCGLKSSEALRDDARRRLDDLTKHDPPRDDAERAWRDLIDKRRFKSALAHAAYAGRTAQACRDYLAPLLGDFLDKLELVRSPRDTKPDTFDLPAPDELVDPPVEYSLALDVRGSLDLLRKDKDALDGLLAQTLAAVALKDDRWFLAVERLAWETARSHIESRAKDARDADAAGRAPLLARAKDAEKRWAANAAAVAKAARKDLAVPKRDTATLLAAFPSEAPGLPAFAARIDDSVKADNPEGALKTVEEDLRSLWKDRARWTIESRAAIATHVAVSVALRGLLAERTVDQIAGDLREFAAWVGLPAEKYGKKVAAVFETLRKFD